MEHGSDHKPNRPFWDCTFCHEPWPCAPAREYLKAITGDSMGLALTMWDFFDQFAIDNGYAPVANAFQRFIGWTRKPPQPL